MSAASPHTFKMQTPPYFLDRFFVHPYQLGEYHEQ
jgi:hypothetical protein